MPTDQESIDKAIHLCSRAGHYFVSAIHSLVAVGASYEDAVGAVCLSAVGAASFYPGWASDIEQIISAAAIANGKSRELVDDAHKEAVDACSLELAQ